MDPGAGPVQRLVHELRSEAGGVPYRVLAQRAGYSVTALPQAAAGQRLPVLPMVLAYAVACGGDPVEWEARWKRTVLRNEAGPRGIDADARGTPRVPPSTQRERVMTQTMGNGEGNRFCKACGTPAEDGKLCNHCGAVLDLPDDASLVEDQGAAVRRDFEERGRR